MPVYLHIIAVFLGGVLVGVGLSQGDDYYLLAGYLLAVSNAAALIPWADEEAW